MDIFINFYNTNWQRIIISTYLDSEYKVITPKNIEDFVL